MARRLLSPRSWRRKKSSAAEPSSPPAPRSTQAAGWELVLAQLDDSRAGEAILEALPDQYTVTTAGEDAHVVRVLVADVTYPDEAVVRLASALDEIDQGWESRLSWPRTSEQT